MPLSNRQLFDTNLKSVTVVSLIYILMEVRSVLGVNLGDSLTTQKNFTAGAISLKKERGLNAASYISGKV